MSVAEDLETKEERRLHLKNDSGTNMYFINKQSES